MYLWYAWVIPYGIGTIVLFFALLKFALSLPRKTPGLLLLASVVFVTGALGLELLGAELVFKGEEGGIPYRLIYTVEETMEMPGVSIFIYTLLKTLQTPVRPKPVEQSRS